VTLLRRTAVTWVLGLVLGGVFLYASVDKIRNPRDFARIVYHYQVIGPSQWLGFVPANVFAVTLPWVEVVVGVLLVTGFWRREAAAVGAALLVAFLVAVSWALAHGVDIENCGCFTVTGKGRAAGAKLLAGDTALLVAALVLAWWRPATPSEDVPAAR
jgi:uncharacterized membrane protein YphA (DoxX/SURF4 family)